jgi:hypothetical protein
MRRDPQRHRWESYEETTNLDNDTLVIIAPNGFIITLNSLEKIADFYKQVAIAEYDKFILPGDGTRLAVKNGLVELEDTDPWINEGFNPGEILFRIRDVVPVLSKYMAVKIGGDRERL